MKKHFLVFMLFVSIVCSFFTVSSASTYTTAQITNNSLLDVYPQANASGQVVWEGWDGTDTEIFLYDSATGTTTKVSNNSSDDLEPQINASGQVVWYGGGGTNYAIFLYDPGTGTTTQLSSNPSWDWHPQINASGQVAWFGWDGTDYEVFLYDPETGTTTLSTNISSNNTYPQVNASGQVAWQGWDGMNVGIYFYDYTTGTTTQIASITYEPGKVDCNPQINAAGQVVWKGWDGTDTEIFLYDSKSGITTQISNNSFDDRNPQINASGKVVWFGWDGTDYEIYLYNSATGITTQVSNNSVDDSFPQINAAGQVVWKGWDGTDYEIFVYHSATGITTQVSNDSSDKSNPQINAAGQVAWAGWDGTDYEIFLASPLPSGDTPIGTDVPVTPVDPNPVVSDTSVSVTFENVTAAGETSVTSSTTGTPPPTGFKLGNPPVYFEISTTAGVEPPIEVCITYTGITYGNENKLRLFHQSAGGAWEDATTSVDTANDIICGEVSSLSPFAPLEADFQFAGFFEPVQSGAEVVNLANAGRTIPMKWQLIDGNGGFISDLGAVTGLNYQEISCAGSSNTFIMPAGDTLASGSSGLRYDAASNQFVYTWKTEKSMVDKCYRLNVELFHLETRSADFEFE